MLKLKNGNNKTKAYYSFKFGAEIESILIVRGWNIDELNEIYAQHGGDEGFEKYASENYEKLIEFFDDKDKDAVTDEQFVDFCVYCTEKYAKYLMS